MIFRPVMLCLGNSPLKPNYSEHLETTTQVDLIVSRQIFELRNYPRIWSVWNHVQHYHYWNGWSCYRRRRCVRGDLFFCIFQPATMRSTVFLFKTINGFTRVRRLDF